MQDDIKFKMDYLLISMNEDAYVNYKTLSQLIGSKPEYRRRFIIINMDDPKYSVLSELVKRQNNNWSSNHILMEYLAAKCIRNEDEFQKMVERYALNLEFDIIQQLCNENPEIFVESNDEDESVNNMVKETMEDLLKNF